MSGGATLECCGAASHRHEVPAHLRQFTDRPLQVVELGDEGCPAIAPVGRCGLRAEKPAVPRHLQCGGKHFPRHRFLGDAVLQRPLPAKAKTPLEQYLLVDVATGTKAQQLLGHHPVGVNKRSEHEMSHQQLTFIQTPRGLSGVQRCIAVMAASAHDRELIPQFVGEFSTSGEEKIELEEFADR